MSYAPLYIQSSAPWLASSKGKINIFYYKDLHTKLNESKSCFVEISQFLAFMKPIWHISNSNDSYGFLVEPSSVGFMVNDF